MIGFVYRWTNQINGKWYIGSHKGTIDDGYRHSSKLLLAAEEKYGAENFIREILFEGDYEKDKIRSVVEARYLNLVNAANNPMSYNLTNISGPECHTQEARQKMGDAQRWRKGKTYEEMYGEQKAKELKGMLLDNAYRKGCTGHKQSEEHVQKRAEKLKGIPQSKEHVQKRADAIRAYHKNKKKGTQ